MVIRFVAALAIAAAWITTVSEAQAQSLQRLTIQSFALSADTVQPKINVPFHLIVTLRVREQVSEIENLELPMLAQVELLGDERQITSGPRGTQYSEIITVVAHVVGQIDISPARLQAIDARDGKPKQWFTNDLRLFAGPAPIEAFHRTTMLLVRVVTILACVLFLALVAAGVVLAVHLGRPRKQPVYVAPPAPEPPAAQRTPRQEIEDALVVLRAEPTRGAAVRVRALVWRMNGFAEGATLADVLSRPGSGASSLRDVLVALERSAFTSDDDLRAAIGDACVALEHYAESFS